MHTTGCYNSVMPALPSLRKPRLLWTLLGVLILASILPLLVSHYFLIGINRESLETLEKKYLTRSAVGTASELENLVSSYQGQLTKIAGGMKMSWDLRHGEDPFAYAAQSGLVGNYISSDSDLLALRIVNTQGQGAEAKPESLDAAVVDELDKGFHAALTGQNYLGGFQPVSVVNQPAMVLAVPITNGNQVMGVVEALVSLRRIADRLRDEAKADVTAFIVDRSGRVLIHSEPAINVQRPDYSRHRIVQEFMKAPVRLTESYEDTVGTKMLGTVAPVGIPDWGVVVEKQQSKAFASVNKMIRRTIEWSAIALVLAIIMGALFATGISGPIRALAERTREIARGNYKERVKIKARNEIGDLAANFNVMSEEVEKAVEQLKKAAHENHLLFINSVRMLAAAIDAKDPYTRGHSERVARYAIAIGKSLSLPAKDMNNLRISALLHDVGKIGIDDRILRKPGALSDEEFEVMKGHPEKGAAIMSGVAQLIDIIPGMKHHHEKWAGGGYPEGLKGEEIPMQARIVAIADTFDAMTTNRPYQKAMELSYVVDKIKSFGGTRFDPRVVDAFVRAWKNGDVQVEDQVRGAA
jgi:HD-GYP domain-containing protein (c-di-GMP phosphodiesterase class II)